MRIGLNNKLKLYGFNNLTKTLSFNIYDICYAKSEREQRDYIKYIDEQYNSERLTKILCDVTEMIGAHVLNISKQDYEPQGASATLLVSEDHLDAEDIDESCNMRIVPAEKQSIAGHLDKSHLTVHTYPEFHPDNEITTFRVDIDVATCGKITRDEHGKKLFIDHDITSIQDYIAKDTLERYDAVDVNVYQSNIFHTKMMIKEIFLQNYLFNTDTYELAPKTRLAINDSLRREMIEIFSGMNIY